jgi:hypothetical protein
VPTGLTISNFTDIEVTLSWTEPDNSVLVGYLVTRTCSETGIDVITTLPRIYNTMKCNTTVCDRVCNRHLPVTCHVSYL